MFSCSIRLRDCAELIMFLGCVSNRKESKMPWTAEEDSEIRALVEELGLRRW
jgi:hypothetical protein